jgi:beta-aspartyl-peptidase (threonine type)
MDYAKSIDIELAPDSYFVTPYHYDLFEKKRREERENINSIAKEQINQRMHGTVGAVAVDQEGCIAAATSTGGTPNCKEGRIGDSSMVGVGSYADNETCAVSGTGDGEYLIRGVICHSISQAMRYKKISLKQACKQVIHQDNKGVEGDMGVIAVDKKGNIAMEFNCDRLLRAWKEGNKPVSSRIY